MPAEPDAAYAARALEDVQRRRDQAIDAQRLPRWFAITGGVALGLNMATPDLLPLLHLEEWWVWWYAVLGPVVVASLVGQYTRWGRNLLGFPPALQVRGIIPPEMVGQRSRSRMLAYFGVVGAIFLTIGVILNYIPYWHLLIGIALGVSMIFESNRRAERLKRLSRYSGRP